MLQYIEAWLETQESIETLSGTFHFSLLSSTIWKIVGYWYHNSVYVLVNLNFRTSWRFSQNFVWTLCLWRISRRRIFQFPASTQTCEAGRTLVSLILRSLENVW